jgi:hypothetical protein
VLVTSNFAELAGVAVPMPICACVIVVTINTKEQIKLVLTEVNIVVFFN